ncbi:MAG: hypothetical protein KJO24_07210 [Gammaproteobacteria bacterium]|nr:hypothetical protein [Gammaproteobacteria bacterium]
MLAASGAPATTIMQVDVDYLLQHAALVIEAEVINRQAKLHSDQRTIYTRVTFRIHEIIKGEYTRPTITLDYAGGTIGERGTVVSAMVYPNPGERGIYFFESPQRRLINPMVGWGQGHFIIERDSNGEDRLFTESKLPVVRVDPPATAKRNKKQPTDPATALPAPSKAYSHGVAIGIQVGERTMPKSQAMGTAVFLRTLRQRLGE